MCVIISSVIDNDTEMCVIITSEIDNDKDMCLFIIRVNDNDKEMRGMTSQVIVNSNKRCIVIRASNW